MAKTATRTRRRNAATPAPSASGDGIARRNGARPGDRILVTGAPGEAAAGLDWLRTGSRRDLQKPTKLRQRWIAPTPRVAAGQMLLHGGVSSMIDISDGLAADLGHLCDASQVDVEIRKDDLPISAALHRYAAIRNKPAWRWVLHGGEDYELLCTAPEHQVHQLRARLQDELGTTLTDIGQILQPGQGRWLQDGKRRQGLSPRGHRHFG